MKNADRPETQAVPPRPSLTRVLWQRLRRTAPTRPDAALPVVPRTAGDFLSPPVSGLRVTWLGHATSLVEIDGRRFLLDPVWAERASPVSWAGPRRFFDPPLALDQLPELDAVLLSHDHYDHLDRRTVLHLARRGVTFVAPTGVGERLVGWGVPRERVREVGWWESVPFGDVHVTATPSRHFSGRSPFMTDRNRTLWSGFAIRGPEHRVYYAGDTGMFDGFDDIGRILGPFDVTLIEIGAYNRMWADVHLGPEQAVEAFRRARGGLLVPVHWATFDLAMHGWTEPIERLLVAARAQGVDVVVPRPGASVDPSDPGPVDRWWPDLPWETAEEHPIRATPIAWRSQLAHAGAR